MGRTIITLVRHGETEWNIAMRLQGMQDSELTEKGIKQAKQAAEVLRSGNFDKIISSDLKRAVETAEILNTFHALPLELNASVRERNFGIMEGLTREEIMERFPETYQGYMQRKNTYPVPEGESLVDFFARVIAGMKKIVAENEGKCLLVVTHGGVLDCMMRMIFDYPLSAPRRFSIDNASINEFSVNNGEWQLECWGNSRFRKDHTQSNSEPEV